MATSTMLAPEEVFVPSSSDLRSRTELTPAQKRELVAALKEERDSRQMGIHLNRRGRRQDVQHTYDEIKRLVSDDRISLLAAL